MKNFGKEIEELFLPYREGREEAIDCCQKVYQYLAGLSDTDKLDDNQKKEISDLAVSLKHNLDQLKDSEEMVKRHPDMDHWAEEKKEADLALTSCLAEAKNKLEAMEEELEKAHRSTINALIASVLGFSLGGVSGWVLSWDLLIPWLLGAYAWQVGLFVSIVLALRIWSSLRRESMTTQVVASALTAPFFTVISTTVILAVATFIMDFAKGLTGQDAINFTVRDSNPTFVNLMQNIFGTAETAVAFIGCIVIGVLVVIVVTRLEDSALKASTRF